MGIGTLEVHPIDLLGAYGMVANGGRLMPRRMITKVVDEDGQTIYPLTDKKPAGKQVVSKQAAYIITDILAGNTDVKVNPFWGEHAIYDKGRRRPAAYKTGTTSDNKDVAAYGYLAPPKDPKAPALAVGIWMGNSDSHAQRRQAVARYVGTPLGRHPDRYQPRDAHRGVQAAGRAADARPSTRSPASSRARSRPRRSRNCSSRARSRRSARRRAWRRRSTRPPACSGRTAASARRSARASST